MKHIVSCILTEEDGTLVKSEAYGPFHDHVAANAYMQRLFDELTSEPEEHGQVEIQDDSDASHFIIEFEDYSKVDLSIQELKPPKP